MAFEGNLLISEWIWTGVIGQVREVHVWSDRPTHKGKNPLWWAQITDRPTDTPPVPETLDWDLWLGTAPYRPYHPAYVPFAWRGWWDFGSGSLGDMGIHNISSEFTAANNCDLRRSVRTDRDQPPRRIISILRRASAA